MFAANTLGSLPPHLLAAMMAQPTLALGGVNPPLPTSSPSGGQNPLAAMPQAKPSPGMFGAGLAMKPPTSNSEAAVQAQQGMAPRFGQGSQGQPGGAMSLSGGVPDISVLSQGPIAGVDQFGLGRDLANLSHVDKVKAKGGPNWGRIGQAVSAGLAGYLAAQGNPAGLALLQQNFQRQREEAEFRNREALERMKASLPQQVGDSLIVPDGHGGFKTVFRDPQPFEAYPLALGLQPGSPEYLEEIKNYRLGPWSDPAVEAKRELEGVRYGFRDALQDDRLASSERNTDVRVAATRRGQDIRSTDTRRGQDVRSTDTRRGQDMNDQRGRRGQDMTDRRTRESASFNGKGGKSGGSDLIGPVYVKDGHRIQFSKSQNKYIQVP